MRVFLRFLPAFLLPLALATGSTLIDDVLAALNNAVDCTSCHALLVPLKALAHVGDTAFVDLFTETCIQSGAEDPDVCQGIISAEGPIIAHDLRQISPAGQTATKLCDALFGLCEPPPVNLFRVQLPPAHPVPRLPRSTGKKPFQVVHMSDVHIDREYTVGADANCTKNICCRIFADSPQNPGEPAGPNGNPRCDSPPSLADSMLQAVANLDGGVKFSIFTGDVVEGLARVLPLPARRLIKTIFVSCVCGKYTGATWLVDKPEVMADLRAFDAQLLARLPQPVFPAIGNHDSAPVNSFPRDSTNATLDSQWVFDVQSEGWAPWLDSVATRQVKHVSGSYSALVPGTRLRIISINTQYWYKQNFWLYDSDTPQPDPKGLLAFLARELHFTEIAGQRAWIIGHIPLGKEDITEDQSNYYDQIVQRFQHTIAGQFFGHSHKDQFEIAYSDFEDQAAFNAVSVGLIAPALTPTSGNPAFKVYDVDPDTYEIMDVRVMFTNITEPSFQTSPVWKEYYSARGTYGPLVGLHPQEPLSPAFWHNLTEVFAANDTAFQLFNTFLSRGGAVSICDSNCRNVSICDMRALRSENNCDHPAAGAPFRKRSASRGRAFARDFVECSGPNIGHIFFRLTASY
ncbi:hypothetical protein HGRIS_011537 [Hohenbuehelia grisea]|uniref:Sphingomyelin phosphodiesterase n=1 Tax=Hohenbuehelia grisea TaxID=104357 RepID=A0ABR3JVG1_9AGAR